MCNCAGHRGALEDDEEDEGDDEEEGEEGEEGEEDEADDEMEVQGGAGVQGVRVLSRMEQDCRSLIVKLLPAVVEVAYSLDAAFVDFMTQGYTTKSYLIEEPLIHVTGLIYLEVGFSGQLIVSNVAFLPVAPGPSLGLLMEGVNTVLVSKLPCFSRIKEVDIQIPERDEFENGIIPLSTSAPHFIVSQLAILHRNGFKAQTLRGQLEDIHPDNFGNYTGFVKTRMSALWRARFH